MDGEKLHTLPKKERLCGKKPISELLAKGKHGAVSGLRYLCLRRNDAELSRIMVSVPKKSFKRAVKRNLLKRRIRESWRKQKHLLAVEGNMDILFMYSTKEILSYSDIYSAVSQIIENLNIRFGSKKPAPLPIASVDGAASVVDAASADGAASVVDDICADGGASAVGVMSDETCVADRVVGPEAGGISEETTISSGGQDVD